ncbi:MAG: hypothetical protein MZU79_03065 [Anaerotruncus sp.]|nr:hypothetical protein [Anaerotruncus sp.]
MAGLGAVMLYLVARYFVARMLAILAVTASARFITLTFFLLSRMPSLTIAGLAMYIVAIFGIYLAIVLFSREKELVAEEPKADDMLPARIISSTKATSQSAGLLYVATIIFAYVALNFFGFGPLAMSPLFAGAAVGLGLTLLLTLTLLSPWSLALAKMFHKWNLESKLPKRKPRRRKTTPEVKTAEPAKKPFSSGSTTRQPRLSFPFI